MLKSNLKTIFEYQEISWNEFSNQNMKSETIKNSLAKLDRQGFNPFRYTANGIRARQYVGVISLAGNNIQVLPKVFKLPNEADKTPIKDNIKGLMYLLQISHKLKISETDISKLSEKFDDLLEVFIYLFTNNLLDLLHNDFQRNYVNQEDNLKYVKGKISFTEHISYNHVYKSKFYCHYDEYEDNILLNQIFKATIKKCIQASSNNFGLLQKCDHLLANVDDKRFTNANICHKIKFTRHNQNYKSVFELAKLLLFGNSPSLNSDNTNTFSIMFDMNKLFEEAIYQIIKSNQNDLKINKITEQSPQYKMFNEKYEYNFVMKPDIVIESSNVGIEKVIIDTKYKLIDTIKSDSNSNKKSVSQSDIYQMFAYNQYYNTDKCILLYPKFNVEIDKILSKENKFNLQIVTVDLFISETDKLNDYKTKIYDQLETIFLKLD